MPTPIILAALLAASPAASDSPERPSSAPGVIALAQGGVTLASCLVGGGLGLGVGIAVATPGSYGAGTALGAAVGAGVGALVGCGLSPLLVNLVGTALGGRGTLGGAALGLLGGVLTGALLVAAGAGLWGASPGVGAIFLGAAPLSVLVGPAIGYAISAPAPEVALVPLAGGGAALSWSGRW